MREVHGVADARKVTAVRDNGTLQHVRIIDGSQGEVIIALSECSFPAAVTPEGARFIAKQLVMAARRVEKAQSK